MQVSSLGFRSDLMLRRLAGSTIVDRGTCLVVHTPQNPDYWWGNFLLLPGPVETVAAAMWETMFTREFPGAAHRAFGVDGTDGATGDPQTLTALGVEADVSTVLTATSAHLSGFDASGSAYRPLKSDADWEQLIDLNLACDDKFADTAMHRDFVRRKRDETRTLVDAGHGAWFGAFTGEELVAGLGIFSDGSGLARYQNVETHPAHRRRGHARRLLHAAGRYAGSELRAHTLVIVADPDYHAIGLYQSVGFVAVERQVQLQKRAY